MRGCASCPMRCVRAATGRPASRKGCSIRPSGARDCCPSNGGSTGQAPLEVNRAKDLPRDLTLDARSFAAELQRLVADLREVDVAEFLITSIEPEKGDDRLLRRRPSATTSSGPAHEAFRVEHVGEWDMAWRRNASGWQVVRVDGRFSPGQPRPRSDLHGDHRGCARGATTLSAASSTSISIRGWRRSTRC